MKATLFVSIASDSILQMLNLDIFSISLLHAVVTEGKTQHSSSPSTSTCTHQPVYRGYYILATTEDVDLVREHDTDSIQECTQLCCSENDCDLVWLVEGVCFTVNCARQELCEPVKAEAGGKFGDSYLALIQRPKKQGMLRGVWGYGKPLNTEKLKISPAILKVLKCGSVRSAIYCLVYVMQHIKGGGGHCR